MVAECLFTMMNDYTVEVGSQHQSISCSNWQAGAVSKQKIRRGLRPMLGVGSDLAEMILLESIRSLRVVPSGRVFSLSCVNHRALPRRCLLA